LIAIPAYMYKPSDALLVWDFINISSTTTKASKLAYRLRGITSYRAVVSGEGVGVGGFDDTACV
jgi:hypothetical protein